jgi:hypothetical protein
MVEAGESEFLGSLIPGKFLIPLNGKNGKNTRFAQVRYTPGTHVIDESGGCCCVCFGGILRWRTDLSRAETRVRRLRVPTILEFNRAFHVKNPLCMAIREPLRSGVGKQY